VLETYAEVESSSASDPHHGQMPGALEVRDGHRYAAPDRPASRHLGSGAMSVGGMSRTRLKTRTAVQLTCDGT
jgi:hypothetical protein